MAEVEGQTQLQVTETQKSWQRGILQAIMLICLVAGILTLIGLVNRMDKDIALGVSIGAYIIIGLLTAPIWAFVDSV